MAISLKTDMRRAWRSVGSHELCVGSRGMEILMLTDWELVILTI